MTTGEVEDKTAEQEELETNLKEFREWYFTEGGADARVCIPEHLDIAQRAWLAGREKPTKIVKSMWGAIMNYFGPEGFVQVLKKVAGRDILNEKNNGSQKRN